MMRGPSTDKNQIGKETGRKGEILCVHTHVPRWGGGLLFVSTFTQGIWPGLAHK